MQLASLQQATQFSTSPLTQGGDADQGFHVGPVVGRAVGVEVAGLLEVASAAR